MKKNLLLCIFAVFVPAHPMQKVPQLLNNQTLSALKNLDNCKFHFSLDDKYMAFSKNNSTQIWDTCAEKAICSLNRITPLQGSNTINDIFFSLDNKFVSTLSQNCLELWNTQDGSRVQVYNLSNNATEAENCIYLGKFSADNKFLIIKKLARTASSTKIYILIWDIVSNSVSNHFYEQVTTTSSSEEDAACFFPSNAIA